jgi:acetoacetyl-CoA synthetase
MRLDVILPKLRTRIAGSLYELRRLYYVRVWGMDIGKGTRISSTAKLDKTNPRGIHIGEATSVGFGAAILAHDFINNQNRDVYIGKNCLIGAHAIILPGVKIGDQCIIAAGCAVMRHVPTGSLVVGNPGRIVETNVITGPLGIRRGGRWSDRRFKKSDG